MDNQSHLPQHHLQDSYSHYPPRSFHAHEPKKKLFGRTNSISRRPGYIRGESGKSPAHPVYAVGGCTCALLALNRARILRDMKMRCHLPKRIIRLSRVHADGRYKRNPSHDEIEIEFDNVGFDWLISISSSFLFFFVRCRDCRLFV